MAALWWLSSALFILLQTRGDSLSESVCRESDKESNWSSYRALETSLRRFDYHVVQVIVGREGGGEGGR